ncbi:MAG: SulP family inorganic anion transporter [Ilumatobacteraceae bacterium]
MGATAARFKRYLHVTGERGGLPLRGFLPIIGWLSRYRWKESFVTDLIAGISVAALLIPESLAYAGIAGVPPEVGLYAAPLALAGYAIFGRSALLVVAASSGISAVSASVVGGIAADEEEFIALTAGLAIATGVVFLVAGVLRFGWVANFLSRAILAGFLVGLSIDIIIGQLDDFFGIELEGSNAIAELVDVFRQIAEWDGLTVTVGVISLASLFVLERFVRRLPAALTVVALSIVAVSVFDLDEDGLLIVGEIPTGLPEYGLPEMTAGQFVELLVGALAIVLIGFSEAFAAATELAKKDGTSIDPNQELIAFGASNLGAGFSSGMVVSGSLSKSEANEGAGAKTQMANLVNAVIVVLTLLFLASLFENLPLATLAAVVIHALWRAADVRKLAPFLGVNPIDFGLGVVTLLAVLLLDTLPAVIIGVVLSLLVLVYRVSYPHTAELGLDPETDTFEDLALHDEAARVPGLVVYRFDAPLEYSNAKAFLDGAIDLVEAADPTPHTLVVDGEVIGDIDSTGIETIADLHGRLESMNVELALARFHGLVLEQISRSESLEGVDLRDVTRTPSHAVRRVVDARRQDPPTP